MTQDMQFIGQKAESSLEIWKEALLRTMPDRHSAESRFNEAIASETVIPLKVIR